MKTILLSGKRGVGKDTAGGIIKEYAATLGYEVALKSFAEPMKKFLLDTFNFEPQYLYGDTKLRNETTNIKWDDVAINKRLDTGSPFLTYRDLLKLIGQGMREQMPNIWAVAAHNAANELIKQNVQPVFMDTRMKNEVLEFGGDCIHIRIFRMTEWSLDPHETETQLDSWDFYPFQTSFDALEYQLPDCSWERTDLIWDQRESSHVNYFVDNNGNRGDLRNALLYILHAEGIK